MNNSKFKLPSITVINEKIEFFKSFDWKTFIAAAPMQEQAASLKKILFQEFNQIISPLLVLEKPYPFPIYRVRKKDKQINSELISEFSYKPKDLCINSQRCNFPFHPVFYGSHDPGTALFEVIRDEKEKHDGTYFVSKWKIYNTKMVKITPYLFSELPDENPFRQYSNKAFNILWECVKNDAVEEQKESLRRYFEFLSQVFLREDYLISATLSDEALFAKHKFRSDIVLYPSYCNDRKSVNVAIQPNFVDNNMRLVRIYEVKINEIVKAEGRFQITINKFADNLNSIIFWQEVNPTDKKYIRNFKSDFHAEKVEFIKRL